MTRLFDFLKNTRTPSALALLLTLACIYLVASLLNLNRVWVYLALILTILGWILYWAIRQMRMKRASEGIEQNFREQMEEAVKTAPVDRKQEIEILRSRLLEAIQAIKTSKLGQLTGRAALYELPWYIVIGNPAAGKSTAIINSGLNFPFSDKNRQVMQGVGGTRNCDWFFTTEGILLDTAGRYAVHEEDRNEWLGFLRLLRKYRPKAPINGIVVVASIDELTTNGPDFSITLAKQLRQRMQELIEQLELFAPVYVMLSKVDLIAGFVDFFEDSDVEERSRVWGATLPYDTHGQGNAAVLFDEHFDRLTDGLRELGTTRMSNNRGQAMSPGILTFPMEFQGIKQHLMTFVATLFEENPYQFKPVFRGFYFTSAVQEGVATHATGQRIVKQFGLSLGRRMTASISSNSGFFLKNLFSAVIFVDRNLVRQYASRHKLLLRQAIFYGGILCLGLWFAGLAWSYRSNQQYVINIQADLDKIGKLQDIRSDWASRLDALDVLQDRLEQLRRYRTDKPLSLGFGLYQGERLEHKLRAEYFKGLQQVMLSPVAANLESFLTEVVSNSTKLADTARSPVITTSSTENALPASSPSPYRDLSPSNPEDAYNALKTYLMLANPSHLDTSHLADQLTRFWRGWLETNRGNASREQITRSAEKLINFYLEQSKEPDFPLIENKLALVDQARDTLRHVVKGIPAKVRVYSEIKMRAATRYPSVTVAGIVGEDNAPIIAGSYAIPGAFTKEAWDQFVESAIKEASTKELRSTDWVLKTASRDDLSLEGSPEQIQRDLVRMYKADYVAEWKKFMQGITIAEFPSFDSAVASMNRLGDPVSSPINKLIQHVYKQTSWDNPSLIKQGLNGAQRGFAEWFRTTILRQTPAQVNVNLSSDAFKIAEAQTGLIGKEFVAITKLAAPRGDSKETSLMNGFLDHLSKIRTRFNQIKNSGDVGPASKQLMQATLDGTNSELADALKYVDENMLTGMSDSERASIRPLLVRPLMQAFAVIVKPTEQELNRTWTAQVHDPFTRTLATKYPFSAEARIEATSSEIAQVFGPDGSIAKFVQASMGPLVVRRGDTIAARTWAEMGVRLNPVFSENIARFLSAPGTAGGQASNSSQPQTNFQLQPIPTSGITEFSIEIDGQTLRYRNGQQEWTNFVWPSQQGAPGAKITAITSDGRNIEIVNFPGQFGLEKLISSAQRRKLENGAFAMTWSEGGAGVTVNFRLISDSRSAAPAAATGSENGLRGIRLPATVVGNEPGNPA